MNQGDFAENIVHKICENMFLSDFVISNPKFKAKTAKKDTSHEISDTLILFKENIIGFQVKSKKISGVKDSKIEISRINRAIAEGVTQLGSINAALRSNILSVTNRVGAEVQLQSVDIKKIIGIVIVDLLGEEDIKNLFYPKIDTGFTVYKGIPTHILTNIDLKLISYEIDTIPDFLRYLNIREDVYSLNLMRGSKNECDFLAYYKRYNDSLKKAIKNKTIITIPQGFWEHYRTEYAVEIDEREEANKVSYEIDKIIQVFYKSIGTNELLQSTFKDKTENSVEDYFSAITELASFDRITRRTQGLKLIEVMKKAVIQPNGSYTLSLNDKCGLIFLASSKPRAEREKFLVQLSSAAYCRFNLKKVIGLATDPASAKSHFFELITVEKRHPDNHNELVKLGKRLFGKIKTEIISEYNRNIKTRSEFPRNKKCPCGSERKFKNCCGAWERLF